MKNGSFAACGDVAAVFLDGFRELDGIVRNERKVMDSISELSRQLEEWEELRGLKSDSVSGVRKAQLR